MHSRTIINLVSKGSFQEALLLYKQLHSSGVHVTSSFLPSLLKACSCSLPLALQLHSYILKTAHISDTVVLNSLLSAYSRHSLIRHARLLFDTSPHRDSVTWSSMVSSYISNDHFQESIDLFNEMHIAAVAPKPELVAAVLSVCGRMSNLALGRAIHACAVTAGQLDASVLLPTSLVDMYSRCGHLDYATKVFDLMPERNVVSWTAMITGCAVNGEHERGIGFLRRMGDEAIKMNRATLITALPACGELGCLKSGREIHGYVFRHGFESESRVAGALIDMYGRCRGGFRLAMIMFERAEERDVVTWSSMMGSCFRNGDCAGALELFKQMREEGIEPNSISMLAVVTACIGLTFLDHGRGLHGYILKSGLDSDVFVGNSLIDMYAKCGCLDSSELVFIGMPERDIVSYSSMITSFAIHGQGHSALKLFRKMQEMGIKPDGITVLAALSACNHSGLVNDAKKLLDGVSRDFDTVLTEEHFACYIDLLGRSGRLEDSFEVARNMPMKPNQKILSSLGSACRIHGRSEAAEELALQVIRSEPKNSANYMLLSATYADKGNWTGMEEVWRVMKERQVTKCAGSSWIEDLNKSVGLSSL